MTYEDECQQAIGLSYEDNFELEDFFADHDCLEDYLESLIEDLEYA